MVRQGDMLSTEDVLEVLSIGLLGIVPDDENIIISTNRGVPIAHNPQTPASIAFHNIARRILGENVPFLDINDRQGGILGWIKGLFRSS